MNTHVVVLRRGRFESIFAIGTKEHCEQRAGALNEQYQTDEYRVEEYR